MKLFSGLICVILIISTGNAQKIGRYTVEEWQTVIDTTWGEGSPTTDKHILKDIMKNDFQPTQALKNNYYNSTEIDSIILELMELYNIPGISACIVSEDHIGWQGYYGYADLEDQKGVNDSTLFTLASVSKLFVATAIMQLWEDGKFDLDDNINDYLPEKLQVVNPFHPNTPITFRMLLCHTSSIDLDWSDDLLSWGQDHTVSLDSFLVNYFMPGGIYYDQGPFIDSVPGSEWHYSNNAFALLGYLVEVIADTPFSDYTHEYIFNPLRMKLAAWFLSELDEELLAAPYDDYRKNQNFGWAAYPAGMLRTNALELANFFIAYMQKGSFENQRILQSATIDSIVSVQSVEDPAWSYWGLGWNIVDPYYYFTRKQGPFYYGYGGFFPAGFVTHAWYDSNTNRAIIVLANGSSRDGTDEITWELIKYAQYYDKIYAIDTKCNPTYIKPDIDSLKITTKFVNPENHTFNSNVIIARADSTIIDSLALYDDGNHNDGHAGDGVWGTKIAPVSEENEFIVSISTTDLSDGTYFNSDDVARFTSIGPLTCSGYVRSSLDTITSPSQGLKLKCRFGLENKGAMAIAQNCSTKIICIDSCASFLQWQPFYISNQNYGNIDPGKSILNQEDQDIYFFNNNCSDTAQFAMEIYSGGYHFWSDTFSVYKDSITVSSKEIENNIPKVFALYQNYPNPFNPKTVISWQLAVSSDVELSIYNILGQKIQTIINKYMPAGHHEIEFTGQNLSSGIYLYRIEAGEWIDVKKMLLLK